MQGASRKSGSPPCSHAGVGGDASCLSPSPCEMLPGLQAFPCMPGRKNHEAKPHVTSPSATPEAKPCVPPPAPTPAEGIPTAWLAHSSWMLPLSHDSWLLSSIQTGPCPCGTLGRQAPRDGRHGRSRCPGWPCTSRPWTTAGLCRCPQPRTALPLVYTRQKGRTR